MSVVTIYQTIVWYDEAAEMMSTALQEHIVLKETDKYFNIRPIDGFACDARNIKKELIDQVRSGGAGFLSPWRQTYHVHQDFKRAKELCLEAVKEIIDRQYRVAAQAKKACDEFKL